MDQRMNVHIENLLLLRAEKMDRRLNQENDDESKVDTIDTLTVLEDVPVSTVRDCCSLIAYYLKIERGFRPIDFRSVEDLTPNERQQYETLHRVENFVQYTNMCRKMIEDVMANGKRVFALLEEEKRNNNERSKNKNDDDNVNEEDGGPSSCKRPRNDDSVLADDLYSTHSLIKNMGGLFNKFHSFFTDQDYMPIATIYEKLFVSSCLSERSPLNLYRAHLADLNTLLSTLTQAVVANTDYCNTLFEAFFGTGILFTALLNIITNEYNGETPVYGHNARRLRYWTRVRLHNPEDVTAAHFIKDVRDPTYQRSLNLLPAELFDRTSGRDVLLTKGDTLCTMFVQFLGRIHLRLYEWIERSDVQSYVTRNFVPVNVQTLFASIGRGQDQRSWIRFFKRTNDGRRAKVYIKLDPLLQMNDEIAVHSDGGMKPKTGAIGGVRHGESAQVRSTAPQATARQYQMLRDFQQRYDEFLAKNGDLLHGVWAGASDKFLRETGTNHSIEMYPQLTAAASPIRSFEVWCKHVNQLLFPYNFLLLSGSDAVDSKDVVTRPLKTFDRETLNHAWTYKCQEYMRFTRAKCEQMLKFMETIEIKSRMFIEEKNFVLLFGDATRDMTFLYDLVAEFIDDDKDNIENDVEMSEC